MEPNMLQTLYQNLIDTESDISVCHYQKFKDQISHIQGKKIVKVLEPLQALEDIISDDCYDKIIWIDDLPDVLQPLINVIPLQFIAYNIALLNHCDIDKPRNLAKSVTVE